MDGIKKFEDFLDKMQGLIDNAKKQGHIIVPIEDLENTFPELKASEDEQHCKWILEYLYDGLRKSDEQFKGQFKSAIAWLEKQGEQIDLVNKEYWRGYREDKQEILDKYSELEKQGEQKTAKTAIEAWKDMRLEVYQQASGNRHEPNYSDDTSKMFSLNDIDEIFEKIADTNIEQKTEWGKEDEEMIHCLEYTVCHYYDDEKTVSEILKWLKSLKPQKQWKPTEGMIKALVDTLSLAKSCGDKGAFDLRELLKQIKKL